MERLGLAKPSGAELTLLILLGASLLALRAFRENYLKVWIAGWSMLVVSRMAEHCFAAVQPCRLSVLLTAHRSLLMAHCSLSLSHIEVVG